MCWLAECGGPVGEPQSLGLAGGVAHLVGPRRPDRREPHIDIRSRLLWQWFLCQRVRVKCFGLFVDLTVQSFLPNTGRGRGLATGGGALVRHFVTRLGRS